jgi:hypothetical protein
MTAKQERIEETNIPLLLGSLVLNLLAILVDTLGTPEERFIENLRLLKAIFAAVSQLVVLLQSFAGIQ